jgi:hypothetical protein
LASRISCEERTLSYVEEDEDMGASRRLDARAQAAAISSAPEGGDVDNSQYF